MNAAGKMVPLNDGNAPAVASATGLGTGGGAAVQQAIGSGFFVIRLHVGAGVASSGQVVLKFASNPPALTYEPEEALPDPLTITGAGTMTQTLSWTGAKMVPGRIYTINGQWTVSR